MTEWIVDGRRVCYDGTSAEAAYAAGCRTRCGECGATHDLSAATPLAPTELTDACLGDLGLVGVHGVALGDGEGAAGEGAAAEIAAVQTPSGMATSVFRVDCDCGASFLAATSVGEWQPARWVALEPALSTPATPPAPTAPPVPPEHPVPAPARTGRDFGQMVAVGVLALVVVGILGVHVWAAHTFLRGRATVNEGRLAVVEVLRVEHDTGPRMVEAWHALVTDGTHQRRLRVSEAHANEAGRELQLEVLTRSDPPLRGHVEVAGERRYDDGPTALLAGDAVLGTAILISWLRQRRSNHRTPEDHRRAG